MQKHKFKHNKLPRNITDESGATTVNIQINGITHLMFDKSKFVGVQSWYVSKTDCKIEVYLKHYVTIKLEYNSIDNWKAVLAILNEQI